MSSTATASSSVTRGTDGCVVCGTVASCPDCGSGEYCVMTSLTCDSCSYTYCAKQSTSQLTGLNSTSTSSSSHSSNKNGEIIGVTLGVIGGVVVIVLVTLFFINKRYWKPRRQRIKASRLEEASRSHGNEDEYFEDGYEDDDDDDDEDDDEDDDGDMRKDENYTKFNAPLVPPSLNVPGNRSSTSTTRTRASNILPIAYIPGVTSALTAEKLQSKLRSGAKRQHAAGDIRSHITLGSSILDGLDEEYDDHNLNARGTHSNDSEDNLITAIRAKPKLVQIAEEESDKEIQDLDIIEEQSESGDAAEDDPHTRNDAAAVDDDDNNDDNDDDDDEGSFILDLEIPESIREGTNDERVESPFEDKFQIHGEQ